MASNVTYNGTVYSIPAPGDQGWGQSLTNFLIDVANSRPAATSMPPIIGINQANLVPTTSTVTAGATLTPVTSYHILSAASPVTLSATTSIAAGTANGQTLLLKGTSNTNPITIQDGSNTALNGDIIIGDGVFILLVYNSISSLWTEVMRSN